MITEAVDIWHIGVLPGDDGRTIRDENGLLVATGEDYALAAIAVFDHNLAAIERLVDGGEINRSQTIALLADLCGFAHAEAVRFADCLFDTRTRGR